MKIKIKYYSYNEEIIKDISSEKIHVFPKSKDKSLGRNQYIFEMENKNQSRSQEDIVESIFSKQPKILGLGEFKTNLFLSDEVVLREEKQVIGFYRALTEKNKKELKVESYYDVIDIAANFLNFFKMLKENRLEKIENLKLWQENIFKLFLEIKNNYIKFLKERNYTDPVFIIQDDNYTSAPLNGYHEVIFYNKLYFSPLEKWIVKKLEEDGFKVTLKLQMKREDFCEETLRLKKVTLEEGEKNIEISTIDDEFTELVHMLKSLEEKQDQEIDYKIFDGNNENFRYNGFFTGSKYISEFPIFRLLDGIHKLLSTLEVIENEIAIELHSVVEVIKYKEISDYYDITLVEMEDLKKIVNDGYKYITKNEMAEQLKFQENPHFLLRIFEDIQVMRTYENLGKWLEKITFNREKLIQLVGEKNIGKYFEALSEIAVIEDLDIVDNWNGFFGHGKKSHGLLKLILKYLEFKEVEGESSVRKIRKSSLEELETKSYKDILFMNLSDKFLPKKVKGSFLLTEQQKKELNIKSSEEDRLEEKYNLFRAISSSENIKILSIKNSEEDSSLSPFVEELINKYKLKVERVKQNQENYLEIVTPISKIKRKEDLSKGETPRDMEFSLEELKNPLKFNAYMTGELFNCKYKMYLRYINSLNKEELEVERSLTLREYGILAHELFEMVLEKIRKEKRYKDIEDGVVDKEFVERSLKDLVGKRRLKLPKLNEKYYKEVVYKNLVNSVEKFFFKISKTIYGEKIEDLIIEKSLKREIINSKEILEVLGVGKADLIIKTDKREHIIDFKTGKLNEMQLDFYSILHKGSSDLTEKYIFNVDKGTLEKSEKIRLVKDEKERHRIDVEEKDKKLQVLEKEVKELLEGKIFTRKKSSICNRCDYLEICKVGEINEK